MQSSTSVLLDALRLTAAIVVFLSHLTGRDLNRTLPWVPWGHEAVVVFFVISGFVIAHVVSTREDTILSYTAARLGRLYSVVVPALAFTLIADTIGRSVDPLFYQQAPSDKPLLRVLANLFFIQQNWNLTVIPFSNGPFWSLGYEFWYYAIFGSWVFTKGGVRIPIVVFLCGLAGPRIIAALPIWLLGVASYKVYRSWYPSPSFQRFLSIASALAIWYVLIFGNPASIITDAVRNICPTNYIELGYFRIFLGDIPRIAEDLLLGIATCSLLIGVRNECSPISLPPRISATIRYFAGATFSLYLFHAPALVSFAALTKLDKFSDIHIIGLGIMVVIFCVCLSHLAERKVYLVRQRFSKMLQSVLS